LPGDVELKLRVKSLHVAFEVVSEAIAFTPYVRELKETLRSNFLLSWW
jgi:hypothetical protein